MALGICGYTAVSEDGRTCFSCISYLSVCYIVFLHAMCDMVTCEYKIFGL